SGPLTLSRSQPKLALIGVVELAKFAVDGAPLKACAPHLPAQDRNDLLPAIRGSGAPLCRKHVTKSACRSICRGLGLISPVLA
ncbi:hypothetical protein, partial [Mesorhizobium sp. M7A.F.Ca.US.007.01.2.1]|uniref:hypothetical protein n=1 Tax=Mesorhizobium sp. M7A.F.Ca.US.007.01.2.1 TaxID=2496711 RepID=UPI0019D246A2